MTARAANVSFGLKGGELALSISCHGHSESATPCHEPTYALQQFGLGAGSLLCVLVSYQAGSRTVNTEPLPGSLATVTSPPIMRASLRVMARPSPVPPKR